MRDPAQFPVFSVGQSDERQGRNAAATCMSGIEIDCEAVLQIQEVCNAAAEKVTHQIAHVGFYHQVHGNGSFRSPFFWLKSVIMHINVL